MTRKNIAKQISYRIPLLVTQIVVYQNKQAFPVCPKCKMPIEREYQSYCDRCGQYLNWNNYNDAEIINKAF